MTFSCDTMDDTVAGMSAIFQSPQPCQPWPRQAQGRDPAAVSGGRLRGSAGAGAQQRGEAGQGAAAAAGCAGRLGHGLMG